MAGMRVWLGLSVLLLALGPSTAAAQPAEPEPTEAAEPSAPPPLVVVVEVWGPSDQANVLRRSLSAALHRRVLALPPEEDAERATLVTVLVSPRRGAITLRTAEGAGETRTVRPEGTTRDATWILPHVVEMLTAVGQGPPAPPPAPAPAPRGDATDGEPSGDAPGDPGPEDDAAGEEPSVGDPGGEGTEEEASGSETTDSQPTAAEGERTGAAASTGPAQPGASTGSAQPGVTSREGAGGLTAPTPSR